MCNLKELVVADVADFLQSVNKSNRLFYNECDLQMALASKLLLSPNKYANVYLEYFVPGSAVNKQMQNCLLDKTKYKSRDLYLDIVVEKYGKFFPIELKYKTAPLNIDIERFGETLQGIDVLKNHGARDLGAYDFWRDVCRIESLIKRFDNIDNGIALFVSNDAGYWTLPADESKPNYMNFSMKDGRKHEKDKFWIGNSSMSPMRPSFSLDNEYETEWKSFNNKFKYCLVMI